jgi:hypothetical protein
MWRLESLCNAQEVSKPRYKDISAPLKPFIHGYNRLEANAVSFGDLDIN